MLSWHQVVIGDTSASGSTATAISGAPYRCAHNRPYYAKICRLEEDAQGSGPPYGGRPTFSGARGSAARWGRRKMRRLDRRSDQEAFLKAWLTLRVTDSTLSPAIFCPSAVSSLILFVEHRNLLSGVCRQDRMMTSRSRVWRENSKTPMVFASAMSL